MHQDLPAQCLRNKNDLLAVVLLCKDSSGAAGRQQIPISQYQGSLGECHIQRSLCLICISNINGKENMYQLILINYIPVLVAKNGGVMPCRLYATCSFYESAREGIQAL